MNCKEFYFEVKPVINFFETFLVERCPALMNVSTIMHKISMINDFIQNNTKTCPFSTTK